MLLLTIRSYCGIYKIVQRMKWFIPFKRGGGIIFKTETHWEILENDNTLISQTFQVFIKKDMINEQPKLKFPIKMRWVREERLYFPYIYTHTHI